MKKKEIIFLLKDAEEIVFPLDDDLDDIDCCYEAPIILKRESEHIVLADIPIYYAMQQVVERLTQALSKKLVISQTINNDIGYVYNQYSFNISQKHLSDSSKTSDKKVPWIGYHYYLWSSCLKSFSCATWLYNDTNGSIIFEVTPLYVAREPEDIDYISYKEWIKDYKPYLIRKIPKEVAQKWLKDANVIVEEINNNIARWREAEE